MELRGGTRNIKQYLGRLWMRSMQSRLLSDMFFVVYLKAELRSRRELDVSSFEILFRSVNLSNRTFL